MFSVIVKRGDGLHPGDDIVDPLIKTLPVALARGRNELDEQAHGLQDVELTIFYRVGLRLGMIVEAHEQLFGTVWYGKIVGLHHKYDETGGETVMTLKRPTSFTVGLPSGTVLPTEAPSSAGVLPTDTGLPSSSSAVIPPGNSDPGPLEDSPPLPTPGDYLTPRTFAVDYTQTFDAANVARSAKFDIVLRAWATGTSAAHGISWSTQVQAANPDVALGHYALLNEHQYPVTPGHDNYGSYLEITANNWWAFSQPGNVLTSWTSQYGAMEVNVTSATNVNGSGQRWPQYKAQYEFDNRLVNVPAVGWVLIDNTFPQPRVIADYDCNGTNEQPTESAAAFVAGFTAFDTALKSHRVGLKTIANTGSSFQDLSTAAGVFNGAFNEGCLGRSWGTFGQKGMLGVRNRQLALIRNTIDGVAVLSVLSSSDLDFRLGRLAITMAGMFDSYLSFVNTVPTIHPVWIDEQAQPVGVRIEDVPSAALQNGIWACETEFGMLLCNPTTEDGVIDITSRGDFTRFSGTQDPTVNNGQPVTGPITVRALDGLVLLRL